MTEVQNKCKNAKIASRKLAVMSSDEKNALLFNIAESLKNSANEIIKANDIDLNNASLKGLSAALMDRLKLNQKRIDGMIEGIYNVIKLDDPIGKIESMWKRPNGLNIGKMRVPLGVIGIIYEARPNVTVDAAVLCLKSGNCVVLRGGSEAIESNKALVKAIKSAFDKSTVPNGAVELIENTSRNAVNEMMKMNEFIDVLIPRGGAGLINAVVNNSTVPVIQTGVGNCHVYIDSDADLNKAKEIAFNAKVQRPGVCNAMETLLVNKNIAKKFLPDMINRYKNAGVEIRGCEIAKSICPDIKLATEEDWATEYLDLILAVKVVADMDEAMEHIYKYGTKHSEAIVTENYTKAMRFLNEVDAAAVYVNASTRFTDGGEFGYGAEIGISTQKLHTRGPMGLNELTTIKYIIMGNGQIRQ